jgi:hypothetical protein
MIFIRYQRRKFNPFNLPDQQYGNEKGIKFNRISRERKNRSSWLMFMIFIIVVILYWYLK